MRKLWIQIDYEQSLFPLREFEEKEQMSERENRTRGSTSSSRFTVTGDFRVRSLVRFPRLSLSGKRDYSYSRVKCRRGHIFFLVPRRQVSEYFWPRGISVKIPCNTTLSTRQLPSLPPPPPNTDYNGKHFMQSSPI